MWLAWRRLPCGICRISWPKASRSGTSEQRSACGRWRARRNLPHFQWSKPSLEVYLALFTQGVLGQWTIPRKTGRDCIEQMTAEVREKREDSRGRIKAPWAQKRGDNHYLDCELMFDAAAVISVLLRVTGRCEKEAVRP